MRSSSPSINDSSEMRLLTRKRLAAFGLSGVSSGLFVAISLWTNLADLSSSFDDSAKGGRNGKKEFTENSLANSGQKEVMSNDAVYCLFVRNGSRKGR